MTHSCPLSLMLWHLGRRGGGPRYTLELARSLLGRDDVRLSLVLSAQSDLHAETMALGIPTLSIETYKDVTGFARGILRLPSIAKAIGDFARAHQAEIALCTMVHLWNPALVGAIRRAGAANGLVVHDAAPHPGDNHLWRGLMLKNDFRQADLLVSLTDSVRAQLVGEQGVAAGKVIASRLGPFRYGAGSPRLLGTPPWRLLFFGRLLPYKGLDRLIEAMRRLEAEGFPARLRLVGQGPLDLGALPGNIDLERRWAPEEEILDLFAKADLAVLPYQEASQSGVLPIAGHLGLPSLVTPVGGLLEQVEQGRLGFIASDASAQGLASAIKRVFADPRLYGEMSEKLLQSGGARQWPEIAGKLVGDLTKWRSLNRF
jgi:glycosyltransferase involved in cell wall biosynthesis